MLLVVDTNVVGVDPPLAGNAMQRLLDASRQGLVRLAVPELVVMEAANAWAHAVVGGIADLAKVEAKLASLGIVQTARERPSVSELRDQKREELTTQLREAFAEVPGLPATPHHELVERALNRIQPFDSGGKDGYRDVLLWEVVIGLAKHKDVIFVSRDIPAFFASKAERVMSRSLALEVSERCGRAQALQLFFDLDEALDCADRLTREEQGREAQATADREAKRLLAALLEQPGPSREVVRQMRDAVLQADLSWDEIGALLPHRKTSDVAIDRIEEVADIKVLDARQLSDRITADISARMLISVDVHLPASVASSIDEDDALVWEGTDRWGDARASALRTVGATFEASFNGDMAVSSMRLQRLARTRR